MKIFGLIFGLRKNALQAYRAIVDPRVPRRLKLYALIAALLVLSPLNILGYIPLLGILDDAGLFSLILIWFTRASAPYQNTIDNS